MFKRFLACLIIACLCLSLLPAAYAAGDGEWDFDAATGTLHLKGTGTMDELFAVRSSFGFLKTVSMPWRDTAAIFSFCRITSNTPQLQMLMPRSRSHSE